MNAPLWQTCGQYTCVPPRRKGCAHGVVPRPAQSYGKDGEQVLRGFSSSTESLALVSEEASAPSVLWQDT